MINEAQKKEQTPEKLKNVPEGAPPSQTIANAHAAGDGALERDGSTMLQSPSGDENKNRRSDREAY